MQRWQWELPTGGIEAGMKPLTIAQHELASSADYHRIPGAGRLPDHLLDNLNIGSVRQLRHITRRFQQVRRCRHVGVTHAEGVHQARDDGFAALVMLADDIFGEPEALGYFLDELAVEDVRLKLLRDQLGDLAAATRVLPGQSHDGHMALRGPLSGPHCHGRRLHGAHAIDEEGESGDQTDQAVNREHDHQAVSDEIHGLTLSR